MSDTATVEESAPAVDAEADAAAIEAIKDRLRITAERLCIEHGHCAEVMNQVYARDNGLGLGEMPYSQTKFDTSFEVTVNGKTLTKTGRYKAYTQEGANWVALNAAGFAPDLPAPLDSSKDTAAVTKYKEKIHNLANAYAGSINRETLNKFLAFMGVRLLPVKRPFVFSVELAPPPTHVTYTIEAYTEEDALAAAKDQMLADERELKNGHNRYYAEGAGTDRRPLVKDAVPTLIEPAAPVESNEDDDDEDDNDDDY